MDRLRGQARGVDLGKLLHDQRWLIKAQGRFQSYMEVGVTGWMKWRAGWVAVGDFQLASGWTYAMIG